MNIIFNNNLKLHRKNIAILQNIFSYSVLIQTKPSYYLFFLLKRRFQFKKSTSALTKII